MLKVLVADDEALARETMQVLLNACPGVSEVKLAEDGNVARQLAVSFQPDLVFLDIEMPGLSGIELARELAGKCVIIFVTAYQQYAVEAFELNAIDYLLKPFDDERFFVAVDRAQQRLKEENHDDYDKINQVVQQILHQQSHQYRDRLVIRDPGRIRLIDVQQIHYITGAGNYAELHLDDGKTILHRETLTVLEKQLDPSVFVRIHRSTIVRRTCITELRPNDKGDYSVILENGEELTLSRRNRGKLEELTH